MLVTLNLLCAGERQELSELLDSANHKANMMQAANSLHGGVVNNSGTLEADKVFQCNKEWHS